jgi:hypothetical protein
MKITRSEASELIARLDAAARGEGRMLDLIMPNGKPLGECTCEYVGQVGKAMQDLGNRLPPALTIVTSR